MSRVSNAFAWLENDDFVAAQQGHHGDGTNAERLAALAVHARVGGGVVAAQGLFGAHAFAREAGIHLQLRADFGGRRPGAGAADHFLVIA